MHLLIQKAIQKATELGAQRYQKRGPGPRMVTKKHADIPAVSTHESWKLIQRKVLDLLVPARPLHADLSAGNRGFECENSIRSNGGRNAPRKRAQNSSSI